LPQKSLFLILLGGYNGKEKLIIINFSNLASPEESHILNYVCKDINPRFLLKAPISSSCNHLNLAKFHMSKDPRGKKEEKRVGKGFKK